MSNKTDGNNFEKEICKMLSKDYGFWALNIPQTNVGQPCDIVAIKNNICLLIDCKMCQTRNTFNFERIEPNQFTAMDFFEAKAGGKALFVFKSTKGKILCVEWETVRSKIDNMETTIKIVDCPLFEQWLEKKVGVKKIESNN